MPSDNKLLETSNNVLTEAIQQVLYPYEGVRDNNFNFFVDHEDHIDDIVHLATLSDAYHKLAQDVSKPSEFSLSNRLLNAFEVAAEQLAGRFVVDDDSATFDPRNSWDLDAIDTLITVSNARENIVSDIPHQSSLDHKLLKVFTVAAQQITEPYEDFETLVDTNLTESGERYTVELLAAVTSARENLIRGMTERYAANMVISLRNGNGA